MTDITSLAIVYMILGGTLTALFASALTGVMISLMLHIANNPDRYAYVVYFVKKMKTKINEVIDTLNKTYATKNLYLDSRVLMANN